MQVFASDLLSTAAHPCAAPPGTYQISGRCGGDLAMAAVSLTLLRAGSALDPGRRPAHGSFST
jgi:hypothetical protein